MAFPGLPGQVVGGGNSAGQLAAARPGACQAAYSNSGPQGPAGRQARTGRREPGLAGKERGWKPQNRLWRAGWRSAADLGNVSHLSWPAGPRVFSPAWALSGPHTAAGELSGTIAPCAGQAGSAPSFVWGQRCLPRASPGRAPHRPHWPTAHRHHCFLDRRRWPGLSPLPPRSPSHQEQGLMPLKLWARADRCCLSFPGSLHFLLLQSPLHRPPDAGSPNSGLVQTVREWGRLGLRCRVAGH